MKQLLFGLVFLGWASVSAAAGPVALSSVRHDYRLLKSASYLLDVGGKLTPQQLLSGAVQARFRPAKEALHLHPQKRPRMRVVWLRVPVTFGEELPKLSSWILQTRLLLPKAPRFYWLKAGKGQEIKPVEHIFFDRLEGTVFFQLKRPKELGDGALYIRFEGRLSMPWLFKQVSLSKASLAHEQAKKWLLLTGFYFGLIFLIILVSFFFYLYQRDTSYLWYTLFQLSVGLYLLLAGPIGWFYVREALLPSPIYLGLSNLTLSFLLLFNSLFARSFLRTKATAPILDALFLLCAFIATCFGISILLGSPLNWVPRVMGIFVPFVVIGGGWLCWRRGYTPARYYFFGQSLFGLCSSWMVMEILGWVPSTGLGIYWMYLGSAIEAILLLLALADRLRGTDQERSQLRREKQKAETRVREHQERLELILNAVQGGIWDWNLLEDEFYISPTYLKSLGYDADAWEFSLGSWARLLHPDDTDVIVDSLQAYLVDPTKQQNYEAEFRLKSGDGWRWILSQARVIESAEPPEPTRMVGTFVDITERKLAQQKIVRSEKMASLGQLMGGIAHEINNPNNFITFNLPLLADALQALEPALEEYAEENPGWQVSHMPYQEFLEETHKLIENMKYGSTRISSLVSELKGFVRSHEKHDRRPVKIERMVAQVLTLVGKQLEQTVARFEVEVAPDLPMVYVDPGKIEQVMLNLLINASHAAEEREEGWVEMTITPCDGLLPSIQIEVVDNGFGIPDDIREKIFDPFFTTKATDLGTGLGLAISHEIVEDHGGQISVESEEGEGTRIRVVLPAVASEVE